VDELEHLASQVVFQVSDLAVLLQLKASVGYGLRGGFLHSEHGFLQAQQLTCCERRWANATPPEWKGPETSQRGKLLVKPLDLVDIARGQLLEDSAKRRVDFFHGRWAISGAADVAFISKLAVFGAARKINNADAYAGERHSGNVVAVPVAVSHYPFPSAQLVKTVQEIVSGWFFAGEGVGASHA